MCGSCLHFGDRDRNGRLKCRFQTWFQQPAIRVEVGVSWAHPLDHPPLAAPSEADTGRTYKIKQPPPPERSIPQKACSPGELCVAQLGAQAPWWTQHLPLPLSSWNPTLFPQNQLYLLQLVALGLLFIHHSLMSPQLSIWSQSPQDVLASSSHAAHS